MAGAAPPTVNKAEFEAVLTAYLGVDAGPRNEAVAYVSFEPSQAVLCVCVLWPLTRDVT